MSAPPDPLPPVPPITAVAAPRTPPLADQPLLFQRAVELLVTPQTHLPLSPDEATQVAQYMRAIAFPAGAVVINEGEDRRADYMLLILEGDVQVDTPLVDTGERLPLVVLGTGSIIGEMSVLDGEPRSATCTAMTPVMAAGLTRKGLELLIEQQPRAAAKLLMGMAQRLADRVRSLGQQVQIYAQIAGDAQPGR